MYGEGRIRRLLRADGFTLIELLIMMVILGILATLSVSAYLGIQTRAENAAAKSSIRAVALVAEAFSIDNVGNKNDVDGRKATVGYEGMTIDLLRANYDGNLAPDLSFKGKPKTDSYCVVYTRGSVNWSAEGPGIGPDSYVENDKCT